MFGRFTVAEISIFGNYVHNRTISNAKKTPEFIVLGNFRYRTFSTSIVVGYGFFDEG